MSIIITQYSLSNIINIQIHNNKLVLLVSKNKNKIYIQYFQCNPNVCSQFDVYTLCHSIITAINKYYPELIQSNVRLLFYNIFNKSNQDFIINNRNMLLLLKWKLYTVNNNKKISSRKYLKNIDNENINIYLKCKYKSLIKNLRIFVSFHNNYKKYKYIFINK